MRLKVNSRTVEVEEARACGFCEPGSINLVIGSLSGASSIEASVSTVHTATCAKDSATLLENRKRT
ncbi:MAG: hypothetical protein ACLUW6_01410 [Coriobacteriaceae bacterium]